MGLTSTLRLSDMLNLIEWFDQEGTGELSTFSKAVHIFLV